MSKRAFTSWLWPSSLSGVAKRARPKTPGLQQPPLARPRRFVSSTARRPRPGLLTAGAGVLTTALLLSLTPTSKPNTTLDHNQEPPPATAPSPSSSPWPRYRLSDVKRHSAASPRPWITHGTSVYDITDWVAAHPGGDIFSIHKQQIESVLAILEGYKVGEVDEADVPLLLSRGGSDVDDPFADDPPRDARLKTLTERPRNAETPAEGLSDFITPTELFYVRNHMWVPVVPEAEADEHTVTVETPDGEETAYTLGELRQRFATHRVTATLQCAGNRRRDMTAHAGRTNGLQWAAGAVSTAEWEGVLLRDVLADAVDRLPPSAKHVHFAGLEAYAASIPIAKALDPLGDVLLAFRMNGEALPRDHGFPVRVVVPGTVAARSVKWLRRITLSDEESPSQWQRRDYKAFCPGAGPEPDWDAAPAIQEMPVTSAVTAVSTEGSRRSGDGEVDGRWLVKAEGYAYSGGGREIARVDVSTDGGRTWRTADLVEDRGAGRRAWCWKRWRYQGFVAGAAGQEHAEGKRITLVVKATDEAYNTQPESHKSIYNVRGNLATAWHRVDVGRGESM
ncbi:hypothetical protein EsH8_I_001251 [Colletotrichum jinshuiense]